MFKEQLRDYGLVLEDDDHGDDGEVDDEADECVSVQAHI